MEMPSPPFWLTVVPLMLKARPMPPWATMPALRVAGDRQLATESVPPLVWTP